jgi:carbonic anhydrase
MKKELEYIRKFSRREILAGGSLAVVGFGLGFGVGDLVNAQPSPQTVGLPATPNDALQLLLQGNQRFVSGSTVVYPNQSVQLRTQLAGGQSPWAVVLGCIDSRVPPELVFDVGLGDIFVSRTAGQVIDDVVLGGIEFGVEEFNSVMLVMVLGHESCGAVKAAIQTIQSNGHADGSIQTLVNAIQPAYESALGQPGDLVGNVINANVALEVEKLKSVDIISDAINAGSIAVVGAYYDLGTGQVTVTVPPS